MHSGTAFDLERALRALPGCGAGAVTQTVPPPSWAQVAQACIQTTAPVQGSCNTGELCAPPPESNFNLCIAHSFDLPCPAGAYSVKRVAYESQNDTRGCSA